MSTSISIKELKELDPSSYQIVDIRDAVEISHGAIPGACDEDRRNRDK